MARLKSFAVIGGIGTGQLIAWGALYYAIAVMGTSLRQELQLSEAGLFAAFAVSLGLNGLLAPWAGRLVDRHGGRVVLTAGALLGAFGFAALAVVQTAWVCFVVLALQGVAMALALYDTCFAALWQQYPQTYRRAVTFVTLVAGLASTVFWPMTHYLIESLGWRATCGTFALLLGVAALINFTVFDARPTALPERAVAAPEGNTRAQDESAPPRALGVIVAFAGASFVNAALAAHLPASLTALQFDSEHAIWIASSVGVMQVAGRALEFALGSGLSAKRLGFITFAGLFASLLILLVSAGSPSLALGFALVYGAANGVITVVRVVLPVELFAPQQLGAVLGRFAAPSLAARAIAPAAFSMIALLLGVSGALACLAVVAGASLATYAYAQTLTRSPPSARARPSAI